MAMPSGDSPQEAREFYDYLMAHHQTEHQEHPDSEPDRELPGRDRTQQRRIGRAEGVQGLGGRWLAAQRWQRSGQGMRALAVGRDGDPVRFGAHQSDPPATRAIASTIAACSSTDASTRPGISSVSRPMRVRCAFRFSIRARIRSFVTCS